MHFVNRLKDLNFLLYYLNFQNFKDLNFEILKVYKDFKVEKIFKVVKVASTKQNHLVEDPEKNNHTTNHNNVKDNQVKVMRPV